MKETLSEIFSAFIIFQFKSHRWDIDNFFSNVHFILQTFLNFFPTKWNSLIWGKTQIPNTSEAPHQLSCNKEISGSEKIRIGFAEVNLVMNGVGIGGGLENNGKIRGFLCEEEFVGLFDEEEPSLEEIKETFEVFDANKDGFVDGGELERVLCSLGLKCNLEECNGLIKPFDTNGDGLIDFREFVKLMETCLF